MRTSRSVPFALDPQSWLSHHHAGKMRKNKIEKMTMRLPVLQRNEGDNQFFYPPSGRACVYVWVANIDTVPAKETEFSLPTHSNLPTISTYYYLDDDNKIKNFVSHLRAHFCTEDSSLAYSGRSLFSRSFTLCMLAFLR